MKRVFLSSIAVVFVISLIGAPSSGAVERVVTKKDCYNKSLLLTGSCTVVYECPPTVDWCVARGDVTVAATQVTGINVKGDVWVASPPGPVPAGMTTASCGGENSGVRRCSATAPLLRVEKGDGVHVACHSNRTFLGLGVLFTETFCRGTFAAVTN